MPKKNVDYSKTIIYKIVCNDLNVKDIYVGSTSDFTRRKYTHKCVCCTPTHNAHNIKIYQTIRANGGWNNWAMVMIETYPCNNKLECVARERYWLEQLQANLNSCIPGRTRQEYREQNAEQIKQYKQQYWHQNAEQIKQKKNVKHTCECGGHYRHSDRARHFKSKKHQNYLISNSNINGNESSTCEAVQQPCSCETHC